LDEKAHRCDVMRARDGQQNEKAATRTPWFLVDLSDNQSANTAWSVAYVRFVHHLAVDRGYSIDIVGFSLAAPSVAVCDNANY
jgi:hypothetical protein